MNSTAATSIPRVIDPLRIYSAQEVRALLGKTLAAQVTALAVCKDHYLGETLFAYLCEIGGQKLLALLDDRNEQNPMSECTKLSTDLISQEYQRKRKRENGLKKGRPRRVCLNRDESA